MNKEIISSSISEAGKGMGHFIGNIKEMPVLSIGEGLTDAEKAMLTLTTVLMSIYSLYFASRSFEGTMNRGHEKFLTAAGALTAVTLSALVNYETWK
ncbi:MAG: hypothetical protein HYT08_04800 [Candidatus Levybacteria bacterium]|nr:hypothetical protein [Candidatus Levybacteria bacterium]